MGEGGEDACNESVEEPHGRASVRQRSLTEAIGTFNNDVPVVSPDLQKPPDEGPQQCHGDAHAEREGEWSGCASVEETRSSIEADVSGVPGHDDNARNFPRELSNGQSDCSNGIHYARLRSYRVTKWTRRRRRDTMETPGTC